MIQEEEKERIMINNLKELKDIFDRNNVTFWLDWGTLLGAVREHKLIPWDWDIDLGALRGDYDKIISISDQIKKAGFLMNEVSIPIADSEFIYRRFGFYKSGYPIDLGVYYPKDKDFFSLLGPGKFKGGLLSKICMKILWLTWFILESDHVSSDSKYNIVAIKVIKFCLTLGSPKQKDFLRKLVKREILKRNYGAPMRMVIIPKHYFETLGKIEFYKEKFNTPFNPEEYLTLKYGTDWRTPKKDAPSWDSKANKISLANKNV